MNGSTQAFQPAARRGSLARLFNLAGIQDPLIGTSLVLMALLGAALEGLSVTLLFPLVASLENDAQLNQTLGPFADLPFAQHLTTVRLAVGVAIGFLIKNAYLALMYFVQFRILSTGEARLATRLFRAYMSSAPHFYLRSDPSVLLKRVTTDTTLVFNQVIFPILLVFVEALTAAVLACVLLYVSPLTALIAGVTLALSKLAFHLAIHRFESNNGQEQERRRTEVFRTVAHGLGGLKELSVLGRSRFYADRLSVQYANYAATYAHKQTLTQLPRLFYETVMVSVASVGVIVLSSVWSQDGGSAIATLAIFGACGLRLVPSLSRISGAYSTLIYYLPSVNAVAEDLERLEGVAYASAATLGRLAHKELAISSLAYQHSDHAEFALTDITMQIPRGTWVAVSGSSGSGKTTLLELIAGVLVPTAGAVLIDGRSLQNMRADWQAVVGYVPQEPYFADDTIEANVAFGIEPTDRDQSRIIQVLKTVSLTSFIGRLPEGAQTVIGDRGARLSGGQRQRLAVARALYHDPEILLLDEATTGLDAETQKNILASLRTTLRGTTVLIVSHDLELIRLCDLQFVIEHGRVRECVDVQS